MAVAGGPCRFCGEDLHDVLVDLGMSPLCESFLAADQLNRMEPFYPLRVLTCRRCALVQLQEYVDPSEIFTEYAYFSSYSTAWLAHARTYTEHDDASASASGATSLVVELASNDGYLLQYFVEAGIPVLGIEPAAQRRRGCDRQAASRRWPSSSTRRSRIASWPRARPPISSSATTSSPMSRTSTPSSRACASSSSRAA